MLDMENAKKRVIVIKREEDKEFTPEKFKDYISTITSDGWNVLDVTGNKNEFIIRLVKNQERINNF